MANSLLEAETCQAETKMYPFYSCLPVIGTTCGFSSTLHILGQLDCPPFPVVCSALSGRVLLDLTISLLTVLPRYCCMCVCYAAVTRSFGCIRVELDANDHSSFQPSWSH
ncbi:unnamed protein product [Protopolystoma xenopodis]|uniref:Uncharacterized protein n=1 Tax=Protopolystoma xenopodis TaxID=117903 RepID=A0A3S5B6U8_9PLAT|nr:unnamed protein product [Protopolystoma xenopodis]